MGESPRRVGCPLCGSPIEVPEGAPRVTCDICSSAVVFQDGEAILESDLERQKRRGGIDPGATTPDVPVGVQTSPDVPVEQQTAPDVPVEQQTAPDVPVGQQTAPDVPVESPEGATEPGGLFAQQTVADAPLVSADDVEEVDPEATSVRGNVVPYGESVDLPLAEQTRVDTHVPSPLDANAFQGSLKDLSIVDVLQLLYSARKTGVLRFRGPEAEGSITLLEGQIIGCEHPTEKAQIGTTLIESGAVTQADVDAALAQQSTAANRLPLVSTLIAMGKIDQEAGWLALEKLVESTVVHVVGWGEGSFVFEVADVTAYDDFRHLPNGVSAKVGLDIQTALLGALKAMDEHDEDDVDLDESLLDAAFVEAASASMRKRDRAEGGMVEIGDLSEEPEPAPRRGIKMSRPLIAVIGAGVVLLLVIIIAVASSSDPDEPADTLTAETSETPELEPTEPEPQPETEPVESEEPSEPEPVAPEPAVYGSEPVVATDVSDAPTKRTKRKRKVKTKTKRRKAKSKNDARSLFDAAVK